MTRRIITLIVSATLALVLAGCGGNPLGPSSGSPTGSTLIVGSQQYYSNEIIAELYAQALESAGYHVDRQYQIGQREVYLPELTAGRIDVFPEYNGNLLQYLDKQATAHTAAEVNAALATALPKGLRPLDTAAATDQDSYTVTRATASSYGLASIADLARLPQPVKVAANSEFQARPYGLPGLKATYNVTGQLVPIEDSGSALTVKALVDGTVSVADIYTASPAIKTNDLVTLSDPAALILPQNVIPIVSSKVDSTAANAINKVSAQLSTSELIGLNDRSVTEQLTSARIASDWLKQKGIV